MAKLAQGLGFNLANTLSSDGEPTPDFLQGVFTAILNAKAHADDLFLLSGQGLQNRCCLILQIAIDPGLGGRDGVRVFDEIGQVAAFFLSHRSLKGDGLLGELENFPYLVHGHVHLLSQFFAGGLSTEFLDKVP